MIFCTSIVKSFVIKLFCDHNFFPRYMWPKIEIKLMTMAKEMLVTFATPFMNGNPNLHLEISHICFFWAIANLEPVREIANAYDAKVHV